MLRPQRTQLGLRIPGVLMSLAFIVVGAWIALGLPESATPLVRDRASGFALASIVIGVIALGISLWMRDLTGFWCRHPRRLGRPR